MLWNGGGAVAAGMCKLTLQCPFDHVVAGSHDNFRKKLNSNARSNIKAPFVVC